MGEAFTHWTIRVALLCLAARLAGDLRWLRSAPWPWWSRIVWTAGCLFFLLHVASAFHFYHHWSHADAFETTAARTNDMLGVRFGEGIYFSYLFTLLWIADVAWWWLAPKSHTRRATWLTSALLVYMAFIAFNGAVVFEDGLTRWIGAPVTAVLLAAAAAVWWRTGLGNPESDSPAPLVEENA